MILSWAVFPLVLAAVGLGWGALVEWAGGERELGALSIPLGLAAAIVVAALLTSFDFSAQAAAPVVAAGAIAGLARAWGRTRVPAPALIAAVGVVLIYGAPVILSGEATFLGYVRLDDTATWLGFVDQFFAHGRSLSSLSDSSTYWLLLNTNLTASGYPSGAFMLPGIGHWITGIDAAWIFQPDLALCAGALALCCFELLAPVLASAWLRAFVAFIAAQSALLFGYAAWGGIKEVTAAFLLALGVAVGVRLLSRERAGPRACVPVALAAAALIVTLGAGAAVYIAPALLIGMSILIWRGCGRRLRPVVLWDVIAVLNVALAALAFQIVPASVLSFATARHTQAAGVLLVALDFAVLGWLPGARGPHQNARRLAGVGVLALAALLIVVLGADATPYVTLAALAGLVAIALTPPAGARAFLAGAGAPLLTLPLTIVLALPAWLTLSTYLPSSSGFAATGADRETQYGNLVAALHWLQIAGIWLDGDFRSLYPPISSVLNHLLIWTVIAAAAFALAWTLRRRSIGLSLYVAVALGVAGDPLAARHGAVADGQVARLLLAGGAARRPRRRGDPVQLRPRAGGDRRRRGARRDLDGRVVVQLPAVPQRHARAARAAGRARKDRRHDRSEGPDLLQRVRDLWRPPLPARGRADRAGGVPRPARCRRSATRG